ncbi:MAG: PBP1A family penicillin-binding protein [Alphaproteobacteria bacterium]|nr:PBP1A family penicillin-binding protein [Alphaproteobacteria bacterium]
MAAKKNQQSKKSLPKTSKKTPTKTSSEKHWLRRYARLGFTLGLWGILLAGIGLVGVFFTLPDPVEVIIAERRPPTITLLDRHGSPFHQLRGYAAKPVRLDEVPALLPTAFLAMEDQRFYEHLGVDPWGILRAIWVNLRAGRIQQGGSTITQQVVKNVFLSSRRTLFRKLQEVLLALWLEQKFSKAQILEIYLNRIYLGSGVYGIAAGAQQYFGKAVSELKLPEIVLLAGLPKAPSQYSPLANPKAASKRALLVLDVLKDYAAISQSQYQQALKLLSTPTTLPVRRARGAYFHRWVVQRLETLNLVGQSDITVYTTLDSGLQMTVENQLHALRPHFEIQRVNQAAVVSMDTTGAVRAMVGGVDWQQSQFNRATQARRQVGSVFKIIVYAAALEAGYSPDSVIRLTRPENTEQWWPEDSTQNSTATLSLRQGMAQSSNALAVTLSEAVGRQKIIAMARRMGISATIPDLPSMALGVAEISLIEMTSAMAVIAAQGRGIEYYGISHVQDSSGREIYRHFSPTHLVLEPRVTAQLQDMLGTVLSEGTGKAARSQSALGGKTGTTQNHRDALFIGYGQDLVSGIWLGNDDGSPMQDTYGSGLPAQIFFEISRIFEH